jgi:hypothetical protein
VRKPRVLLGFALALAWLAAPHPVRAQAPVNAGIPDLIGARGLALGAYRGVLTGNDGLYTNAASLAAQKRYSIEGQYLIDRADGANALEAFSVSVVDSTSSAVTGGVAYTRVFSGPWVGNLIDVPIAFPASNSLFLGVNGKYTSIGGPAGDSMRTLNFDAGAYLKASSLIGLGVAGYNLVNAGHLMEAPRGIGAGLSVGDAVHYLVAFDWRGDFDRQSQFTNLYALGGEYLLAGSYPLRASFVKDDTRNANFWSVGAGLVVSGGFAVDLSYRQRIESPQEFTVAAGVKFFLFQ